MLFAYMQAGLGSFMETVDISTIIATITHYRVKRCLQQLLILHHKRFLQAAIRLERLIHLRLGFDF